MDLNGATALVTGASSGIGRATSIELAKEGAVPAICARRKDRLDEALEACRALQPRAISIQCDVADAHAVERMVEQVAAELGSVDVLVANAGWGHYRSFDEESFEDIDAMVRANVLGQMFATRAVLPHMKARHRGHIVLLSSTNARIPPPMMAVYNATRSATVGFAEGLAPEVKAFGIGVTLVYPGAIATEFFDAPEFQKMRRPKPIPAENVARRIVQAIKRNRFEVAVPRVLNVPAKMKAIFPQLVRPGVARYAKDALPKP